MEGKTRVPSDYEESFRKARLTFLHQRVYNPATRRVEHLTPLPNPENHDDLSFLGSDLDEDTAHLIAIGDIDPTTHERFDCVKPSVIKKAAPPIENAFQLMMANSTADVTRSTSISMLDVKETDKIEEPQTKKRKHDNAMKDKENVDVNVRQPAPKGGAFGRLFRQSLEQNRFKRFASPCL